MFAVWLSMLGVAEANCPWTKIDSVYATMTSITINKETYIVKGSIARAQFIATLQECDVNGTAVAKFDDWRAMRRWTNISGIVGACCFFPVLIATPITAVLAGQRKEELIAILSGMK